MSIAGPSATFGPETCDSWYERGIDSEVVFLLWEDGLCTTGAAAEEVAAAEEEYAQRWPDGGLGWNEAADYVGRLVAGAAARRFHDLRSRGDLFV